MIYDINSVDKPLIFCMCFNSPSTKHKGSFRNLTPLSLYKSANFSLLKWQVKVHIGNQVNNPPDIEQCFYGLDNYE